LVEVLLKLTLLVLQRCIQVLLCVEIGS
jgi:hypothetical protein